MNRSESDKAFIDPDLTAQEFRKLGYGVIDMIADYYSTIRQVPVFPRIPPARWKVNFRRNCPYGTGSGHHPGGVAD
jgi:hypothetical protein